jgi:uncharacterized protein
MQMTNAAPPAPQSRLAGLDLARYLAFVGMVIVNFKIAMGAENDGGWLSLLSGALEGRAAATFVVLAGIGLGLAGRKALNQTVSVSLRRAVFLLAIGLMNMLIFEADILHYYAFYFLFGVLLLPLSSRTLVMAILALNLAFVAMVFLFEYDTGWNWETFAYADFWTPAGFVRNLFFNGWHPVIPWLGFLLFGTVLSRLALSERRAQVALVGLGAGALAFAEGASIVLANMLVPLDAEFALLVTTDPVPPMPLYSLAGFGAASLVIGLCLMVAEPLGRWRILPLIVPAGRQTLTLYIAHILVGMGTLEALNMLGGQTTAQAVGAALSFCLGATIYANIWSLAFKRGPIEALMRKVAG